MLVVFYEPETGVGLNPKQPFCDYGLQLARRGFVTAAILVFAHTIGEFGVVLMIGGNIPGSTRTLSILIYDQVQDFAYAQANRTALLLVIIALAALVLLYSLRRAPYSEARRA